jgi:hypothetical protein
MVGIALWPGASVKSNYFNRQGESSFFRVESRKLYFYFAVEIQKPLKKIVS